MTKLQHNYTTYFTFLHDQKALAYFFLQLRCKTMGSKVAQSPALSPIDVLSAYAYCLLTKGAQLKLFNMQLLAVFGTFPFVHYSSKCKHFLEPAHKNRLAP